MDERGKDDMSDLEAIVEFNRERNKAFLSLDEARIRAFWLSERGWSALDDGDL